MNLILGTMTFGEQLFEDDVSEIVKNFLDSGYREIDTAYVYNEGRSEELIGMCLKQLGPDKVKIATKANPRATGRLDGDAVRLQFMKSLERMGVDSVDILYLHFPDRNTPIESALEACDEFHKQGKLKELGLSNFPAWLVSYVYHICKEREWVLPTVYEGLYNPLSRKAENELNEALNAYHIRFHAYNPLAGGMLTNKYGSFADGPTKGRFTYRPNYQNRYWKQSYFDGIGLVKEACRKEDVDIAAAAYRWMAYHSMLSGERGDGLIAGFSRMSQLQQNLAALQQGPLPERILSAFSEAWKLCKHDAPEYFKYYQG
ncbi:aldo/keto reductase [Clostridium sp. AM58-1XD]|nr:aldo/keto reductase [Clostridium sp. AM58-1XD]